MADANPSDSGRRQDTCIDLEKKVEALARELSEARERETATSEVLRVISSSPSDVQPVFNTIVMSAARLCKAQFCWVFRFDGKLLHFVAEYGLSPEYIEAIRRKYPNHPDGHQLRPVRSLQALLLKFLMSKRTLTMSIATTQRPLTSAAFWRSPCSKTATSSGQLS
jgi:hypothetical protein